MQETSIGVFDSSSGGLSIWKEIVTLLPKVSTIYVGDQQYMPYSNKTTPFIRERALHIIRFLLQKKARYIIIACNTATVAGIEFYRKTFPLVPIVGVVPVIKTAASVSENKKIAIFSTHYTAKSAYQKRLIDQFAGNCAVSCIGSTKLISLIENGKLASNSLDNELRLKLGALRRNGVDTLVLGCTHFPFVIRQIRAIVGKDMTILDSGAAVARQVKRIVEQNSDLSTVSQPLHYFYTTGEARSVENTMSLLLGKTIHVAYENI